MVMLLWKSLFITLPMNEFGYIWATVLLLPFGVSFLLTLKGTFPGQSDVLHISRYFSVLLGAPAALCLATGFTSGEGIQFIIALSPVYLWPVTVAMVVVSATAGAFRHDLDQFRRRNS